MRSTSESKQVESALATLNTLRSSGKSPAGIESLRKSLGNKNNLVAAKAAAIAEQWQAVELADELAAAFARFLNNPTKTDKGCAAKTAIVKALYELGTDRLDVFL